MFESRLAKRISDAKDGKRGWKTYLSFVGVIFVVLTMTSSITAAPHVVIYVGTDTSFAVFEGNYAYYSNVVKFALPYTDDWACTKVACPGRLSSLSSLSYWVSVEEPGVFDPMENPLEPYVVLKLSGGKHLFCFPPDAYSKEGWSFPYQGVWEKRDVVKDGLWRVEPVHLSLELPLSEWIGILGNRQVTGVFICVGEWDLTGPHVCRIGDFSINGKLMDFANAMPYKPGMANTPEWMLTSEGATMFSPFPAGARSRF